MADYSYVRISSLDQNEDRQMLAMHKLGIPASCIFTDKQSGKDFLRPAWQSLTNKLEQGDLLYLHSIDRLGRNYEEILNWWRILTKEKGVDIVVLDMPLLNTRQDRDLLGTLIADLVLSLLSYVAHNERIAIRSRQAEGIAAAKMRGVRFGRPIKKPPADFVMLVEQWENGNMTVDSVLEQTGLKASTFYRRLREHRNMERKK